MKSIIFGLLLSVLVVSSAWAVPTGSMAPDFKLPAVDGSSVSLSELKGKVVVLEWFNASCPFVKKHYNKNDMQALQKKWTDQGVVWLTIDSTNKEHPSFQNVAKLKQTVAEKQIAASSLLADSSGEVGKLYEATTTPHMFLIDSEGKIAYQGAIDDNPDAFADPKKSKNFVDLALSEVVAGKKVSKAETKAYGCSVKY